MTAPNQFHAPTDTPTDRPTDTPTDTEPTEETLRQMTGAPDINQPLVSKEAFADIDIRSARPVWKLPFPKLALIATVLVPVFGLAGYFLAGGRTTQQQATLPNNSPEESVAPEEAVESSGLQAAEQEIARLKSQMALDDQAYVQESQRPTSPTGQSSPASESTSTTASSTAEPQPQAVAVTTRSTPPTVSYSPPPPPIQASVPGFSRAASPSAIPDSFVTVDPFQQWRQLAQLGSYGSTGNRNAERQLESGRAVANSPDNIINESLGREGTVPVAYFAATSATMPSSQSVRFQAEPATEQLSDEAQKEGLYKPAEEQTDTEGLPTEDVPKTESPPILAEAEARILTEPTLGTVSSMQSLIAGGYAAGELITPVVLDNEGVENRFMVILSEPLTDNASRTAIPAGALLVVQIDRVSENGLVQLSATQAIWEEQGLQRELVLPSQTLLIRGNGGNPLMAESYGDMGGDIAAMDMGQFALGAIGRIGELYTRSDSRVQTGEGTTVITESNPAPNILAGALEGGSEAVLDAISERNQQTIETLRERPSVPYIPADTSVQVFVNQSMQMPSGF